MSETRNNAERALVTCGWWLHLGLVGAVALAAGLLQLFDVGTHWLSALALAFFGGVLAAASWRRGLTVLEDAEPASAVSTNAPSDSTSRALSRQAAPGAKAMLSLIALQSNRRRDDALRHPTLE